MAPEPHISNLFFSAFLSCLELSDAKVNDPQVRALLGTASHVCTVVILRYIKNNHAQGVVGMWRLTRDLHLLESITFMSEANQKLVRTRIATPKTEFFR